MLATPQKNPNHQYNVGEHVLRTVELIGNRELQAAHIKKLLPDFEAEAVLSDGKWSKKELQLLRWGALLHDVAKPEVHVVNEKGEDRFPEHAAASAMQAKEVLKRLKFDNETIGYVVRLVAAHDYYQYEKTETGMRRTMYRLGPDLMNLLWELQLADVLTQSPVLLRQKLSELALARHLHRIVTSRGDCVSVKQLAVNGRDLMEAGFSSGPQIGSVLLELLETVLTEPEKNKKELLLLQAQELQGRS